MEMVHDIKNNVANINDEGQVKDYLIKIIKKEANDKSGLIYDMGHAIYTLSDPRAVQIKKMAKELAESGDLYNEFCLLNTIEKLTPELMAEYKGISKAMCANVDLYSGLVYSALGVPEDLLTPIFATARISGWCAHRLEEITTGGKIMRPAYKAVWKDQPYIELADR